MSASAHEAQWSELPYAAWKDTIATLQLWTQIVGKIPLAVSPWLNHSWHVTFQPTARGLTTRLMHVGPLALQIEFDFVDHVLWLRTSDGHSRQLMLKPMTVAEFHAEVLRALAELGCPAEIDPLPCEIPTVIPFDRDTEHRAYDREYVTRFWRVLLSVHEVFAYFRTGFLGKASPVHFFWGGFDLAVTRFSGRRAPLHPGGIPHLSDAVTREAYSHEVSSAGFWPGGGPIDDAAFYSYAYPQPAGFDAAPVRPAAASFHRELGEFLLPYDAVRSATDPRATLLAFLESTYAAAADLGKWNRAELDAPYGQPGIPRAV